MIRTLPELLSSSFRGAVQCIPCSLHLPLPFGGLRRLAAGFLHLGQRPTDGYALEKIKNESFLATFPW
jgi:hypothetical protein